MSENETIESNVGCGCNRNNCPIVETELGKVQGKICLDKNDNIYYSYMSIPYAKPPIGKHRFKAPKPAKPWPEVLDATKDMPSCIQINIFTKEITGEEDCLYLNVHTAQLPGEDGTDLRPVMFYIHGDGFFEGSGNTTFCGAEYLMQCGVVLVSINYRLGMFGFASSTDNNIRVPGNMGLKDQNLALRWTNRNIEFFGGDPYNVTIFGNSSGGVCTHLHVLSPMSRGLFHKAFIISGSALEPWANGVKGTLELKAKMLDIPTDNRKEMLKQLQELPATAIVSTHNITALGVPVHEPFECAPVIETQKKYERFLPEPPIDILRSGYYSHVPMIIGHTDLEGVFVEMCTKWITRRNFYLRDFIMAIPCDLRVPREEKCELGQKIKREYYGNEDPSTENTNKFADLAGDIWFVNGIRHAIKEHVRNGDTVYFYKFCADTKLNFIKRKDCDNIDTPGATHTDDTGYLFKTKISPEFEKNSIEDKAINRILKLWTHFAKYGKPTTMNSSVPWIPVTVAKMHCMKIGTEALKTAPDPDSKHFEFWNDLYYKYGRSWKITTYEDEESN